MDREVIRPEDFFRTASDWIAGRILDAQKGDGIFALSLCGGSTPGPIYKALAARSDIDWNRVLITFGDERCVGPDDEQSNYRMVKESLLDPAGIPASNVIRIEGELDPAEAARKCEARLRKFAEAEGVDIFAHDLILLGMGDDGHTASLFPDTAALEEKDRWVMENRVDTFDSHRITFTYPLIAAAKDVFFLVNGSNKHEVADAVLNGDPQYPSTAITAAEKVVWFIGDS